MTHPLKILSLGAGVQSTTLLLMSICGELPRIDHAIFADTQYEPPAVYRHLDWLEEQCASVGIPLHVVTRGNLRSDAIEFRSRRFTEDEKGAKRHASIPLFVLNADGSQGIIRRQCTSEYKIEPIERFIRRNLLGLAPKQRAPKHVVVEHWFGITWDEAGRMRRSPDAWKRNVYPFCGRHGDDLLPKMWRRQDCINWLGTNYPDRVVPRSACICCPYRSNEEWRRMRDEDPESWTDAVAFDAAMRRADAAMRRADAAGQQSKWRNQLAGLPFVHRQMVPLDQADLRSDDEKNGQMNIWGMQNECEGMCGV